MELKMDLICGNESLGYVIFRIWYDKIKEMKTVEACKGATKNETRKLPL